MFKYLLVTILLIGSVFAGDSDGYFLSPPLPPTAFVGQYYTAQFRVVGLDFPSFKFSGLPKCFVGTSDGAIEGNPDKAGSYAVTITFTDGGKSYSRQIVVRIASSVSSTEGTNEAGVLSQNQFIIVSPSNNYVYQAGDQINLKLAANNGVSPYTWSYINLPSELRGDKDGVLNGVFNREGYYSFSASCSDSNGKAVDSYFTFNVQPKTLTKSNIVEVPNRNVPYRYNLDQVAGQTIAATNAVYAAIANVDDQQKKVTHTREDYAKTKMALDFATAQENNAESVVAQAISEQNLAQAAASKSAAVVENANKILALTQTNLDNANRGVKDAKEGLQKASKNVDLVKHILNDANEDYINAVTATSKAAENAKLLLAADLDARNVYNIAFNSLGDAKNVVAASNTKNQQAGVLVSNAQNALNVVNQANDDAQSGLQIAQAALNKANSVLEAANNLVSKTRRDLGQAADDLGVSKFNYQQAMNNLFVAQARAEQAKKATNIVSSQVSTVTEANSTSTYIFAGCVQNTYPSISGSVSISKKTTYGYALNSGHVLVYGECTQKDVEPCNQGDIVQYNGYIKEGVVHAVSVKKFKRQ